MHNGVGGDGASLAQEWMGPVDRVLCICHILCFQSCACTVRARTVSPTDWAAPWAPSRPPTSTGP